MTVNALNTYILPIYIYCTSTFNVKMWHIDEIRNLFLNKLKLFLNLSEYHF